ncbi:MAG: carboxypeptidase-like regulatory domain-containing protein [Acidobacteriia bacterium]|nr:carboxypeptidase-like regulatory domain-containing protein [Terriglobia bacterium]
MAVVLLLPLPAVAFCRFPQPRLVCAEYFASQIVVEATLTQMDKLHDKDDPEGISAYLYTLRVNQVLRGKIAGAIKVYEGNDSGRAPFDWVAGREYLLFLFHAPDEKSWALDGCGNSSPLSEAKMALSEIALIKAAHRGGVIHGAVSEQALSTPIAGVHVEAQGTGGRYTATTNDKGEFQLKVPAGRYIVLANKEGSTFDTAFISYEDPRNIQIEPGGCAQVQFARAEGPPTQ